jgi:hypothetical protein
VRVALRQLSRRCRDHCYWSLAGPDGSGSAGGVCCPRSRTALRSAWRRFVPSSGRDLTPKPGGRLAPRRGRGVAARRSAHHHQVKPLVGRHGVPARVVGEDRDARRTGRDVGRARRVEVRNLDDLGALADVLMKVTSYSPLPRVLLSEVAPLAKASEPLESTTAQSVFCLRAQEAT